MTGPIESGFRLSPQQLRAWRRQREEGSSCSVLGALHLEGDLDRHALRRALAATVARHEILRTAFRLPAGLSLPLQVILEPGPVSLPEIDLRGLAAESRPAATALLGELGASPFDLEQGEGWRAALVRLGPGEGALLWALSAVCADPAAFEPLAADLLAAYARQRAGGGPDPEPPLQVADVAEWQNSLLEGEGATEGLEIWREHWREQEIEARLALPLPLQESETAPGPFAPREEAVPLARETAGALAGLAAVWGYAPQVLLLTAWIAVIQRGTGRDESVTGVLDPGRDAEELRGVVGPLARSLPVAVRFRPESPFCEAVAEVGQALKRAESWGEYFSWEHVAGDGHGHGGFPVGFAAGTQGWTRNVDGLRATSTGSWPGGAVDRFALSLSWTGEGEELRLAVGYDPRRFRREAVRSLAGRLAALLGSVAVRPGIPLAEHPAMAEDEQARWLDRSVAPPATDRGRQDRTLHAVFEEQADRTPDRLAVIASDTAGDGRLTFRELDLRANRLAHHLRAAGAGPEVIVALCLERSVEAVVAVLAVWKAGAAYVPLDPTQPAERLAWLLEDTGAPLLVTDVRLAAGLPGVSTGLRTIRLDDLDGEAAAIALRPDGRPAGEAGPRHLAYVIYTSGSTGRPKGVQVEHRSALHLLAALEAAVLDPLAESGLRPDPLLASLNAPMIFDASVQQLALLLAGHALCVVPQDIRADGEALVTFLREQGVDLLDCTPSQLRLLVSAGLLDGPAGPRIVLTAGEAVDEPLWRRLAQAERTVSFNLYGPTEASVDATFHRIQPGSTHPTIGRPLAGYEVFLLDRFLQPVPPGAPGELCLGGAGLARGYLRRPDLTAERFVPHPFAGRPGERLYRTGDLGRHLPNGGLEGDLEGGLEILGRLDHQVKIRGFRIELGEIEAVLAEQAGVREAVVVVHESAESGETGGGERRLVAWLTGDAPAGALREALLRRLPDFMLPAAFVTLAALPLTPNGKVDRRALSRLELPGRAPVPPRTVAELAVAQAFEELLGVPVGAEDSFFALGGHSLLSVRLMARLRRQFGRDLPIAELFAHPTVATLARRLDAEGGLPWSPLVPIQPLGERTPLFCIHPGGGEILCYYNLARRLGTDQPFYGLQARPVEGHEPPRTTIEEMAAEYLDAVRSRQPRGPYLLAGYSLGGVVAFEMARQLTQAGEEVELLALLDTALPPGDATAEIDTATMIAIILRQRAREQGKPLELDEDALRALPVDGQLAQALEVLRGLEALAAEIDLPVLRSLVLGYCSRETALERYRASIWPGRITLLRARDIDPASPRDIHPQRRQILDDPTLGWATVAAGGVEVHTVPGYHHTIIQGPDLETLAETLRTCIAGPARQPQLA
jgi:amino acid adenylation domain-containing protein